jgi:RimJ/RimL family protein N-acetyltransferase
MRPERHEIGTPISSARMTGPVTLREVTDADLPIFFAHQRDPGACRMANVPARDRDAFMAHRARILGDGSVVVRTVEMGGVVAGNVVSWVHDGERDVGSWIGREHWGLGVATAALASFLTLLLERPLSAHVAEHNAGSVRVLEKCGFVAVDRVEIAGEPVTELLLRLDGSYDSATIA